MKTKGSPCKTVASRKAKGRHGQQLVVDSILTAFPDLTVNDVRSIPGSVPGPDLWLSEAAIKYFGFDVEVKNCEKINIWSVIKQLENRRTQTSMQPLIIFKRNHTALWAALPLENLLNLIKGSTDAKATE